MDSPKVLATSDQSQWCHTELQVPGQQQSQSQSHYSNWTSWVNNKKSSFETTPTSIQSWIWGQQPGHLHRVPGHGVSGVGVRLSKYKSSKVLVPRAARSLLLLCLQFPFFQPHSLMLVTDTRTGIIALGHPKIPPSHGLKVCYCFASFEWHHARTTEIRACLWTSPLPSFLEEEQSQSLFLEH